MPNKNPLQYILSQRVIKVKLPLLDEFNNFLLSLEATVFYELPKEFALI